MSDGSSADIALHYQEHGLVDAPTIVMAHTLGADLHMWDEQVERLSDAFRIVRYDLRGHGGSDLGVGFATAELLAEDALRLMDRLDLTTAHFCGAGLGGAVGLTMATRAPDRVSSLILCGAGARFPNRLLWNEEISDAAERGLAALAPETMQRWFTPGFDAASAARAQKLRASFEQTTVDGFIACCIAQRDVDLRADLERISAPILSIAGADDHIAPKPLLRELRQLAPNVKTAALDGAAHMACVEQPDAFAELVRQFVAKPPVRGSVIHDAI